MLSKFKISQNQTCDVYYELFIDKSVGRNVFHTFAANGCKSKHISTCELFKNGRNVIALDAYGVMKTILSITLAQSYTHAIRQEILENLDWLDLHSSDGLQKQGFQLAFRELNNPDFSKVGFTMQPLYLIIENYRGTGANAFLARSPSFRLVATDNRHVIRLDQMFVSFFNEVYE